MHAGLNTEEAVGSNLGTVNNQKKREVVFEGRNTRNSKKWPQRAVSETSHCLFLIGHAGKGVGS